MFCRRDVLRFGAAVTTSAVLPSCKADEGLDPVYATVLPGPDQVDDALSSLIPGTRYRATYSMQTPAAVVGAAEPLVTIVEFSDFQCPFCGTMAATLHELVVAYPKDVRVVFRQFPLPFHQQAEPAARATLAAGLQRRFWAMHDTLFANRSALSADDLRAHADRVGLEAAAFERDTQDPSVASRVQAEIAQGKGLGVSGTPSMFINGFRVGGMLDASKLAEVVDGERRVAASLIKAGSTRAQVYARFRRAAGAK